MRRKARCSIRSGGEGQVPATRRGERQPRAQLTLVVNRRNGERLEVPVTCRLDSDEDVLIYEAGGVLQRFAQDFLQASSN